MPIRAVQYPVKESAHIVSHAQPLGDSFKWLGIPSDCKLRMDLGVREVVGQASWKLTTILRARRFHEVPQLGQLYKSKVLSFVEYRTPAVYHAAKTTLAGIDVVQTRFLSECSLSDEDVLLHFKLALLEARRDVAMLGLMHRTVLGCGPRHFGDMFQPAPPLVLRTHCKQLCSHGGPRDLKMFTRSTSTIFGLNLWSERSGNAARIASAPEVSGFEWRRQLSHLLARVLLSEHPWHLFY